MKLPWSIRLPLLVWCAVLGFVVGLGWCSPATPLEYGVVLVAIAALSAAVVWLVRRAFAAGLDRGAPHWPVRGTRPEKSGAGKN